MSETPLEEVKGKKKPVTKKKVKPKVEPKPEPVVVKEETFLDRLKKEKSELDTKIKALFVFTRSEMEGVTYTEKTLLKDQLALMQSYSHILDKRLNLIRE